MENKNDFIGGLNKIIVMRRPKRSRAQIDFMKGLMQMTSAKEMCGVTYDKSKTNDLCDGRVMKFYKYTSPEHFRNGGYEEHNIATYQKVIIDIPPRKFYSVEEIKVFLDITERRAGRRLEMAEKELMLSYITNKQHYELVGLVQITKGQHEMTLFNDIKKGY